MAGEVFYLKKGRLKESLVTLACSRKSLITRS
jgi:hypothetical protein